VRFSQLPDSDLGSLWWLSDPEEYCEECAWDPVEIGDTYDPDTLFSFETVGCESYECEGGETSFKVLAHNEEGTDNVVVPVIVEGSDCEE